MDEVGCSENLLQNVNTKWWVEAAHNAMNGTNVENVKKHT